MEQWRSEAREHEKQMFGLFCTTIANCNQALSDMVKAKQAADARVKQLEAELASRDQPRVTPSSTPSPSLQIVVEDDGS